MGRPSTVTPERGEVLLSEYKKTGNIAAAARAAGVSHAAAFRYLEATPAAAAPVVAQQRQVIEAKGASLFDTRGALEANYARVLRLIDQLETGIVLVDEDDEDRGYETRISPAVLIAALREAREHVTAGMKLYALMLDVDEVRKFQESVLEAIGEADAATRDRIRAKLQERSALGLALS